MGRLINPLVADADRRDSAPSEREWIRYVTDEDFETVMALIDTKAFDAPWAAQLVKDVHDRAVARMTAQAHPAPTPPADVAELGSWFKAKWAEANDATRDTLRTLAAALGRVELLPLRRRQRAPLNPAPPDSTNAPVAVESRSTPVTDRTRLVSPVADANTPLSSESDWGDGTDVENLSGRPVREWFRRDPSWW
jgi:hypothetical protein